MSLSECMKCGGHIPLGPRASNVCEDCGAGVLALAETQPGVDHLRAEIGRLLETTKWKPIATVPMLQQVLLSHNKHGNTWITIGIVYPKSGPEYATHWMQLPAFPPNDQVAGPRYRVWCSDWLGPAWA